MISDEALMVYLDGQLEPGRAQAIEAALAEDAALRARLAELQHVDEQVKAAFEPLLQPVPDRLLERIRAARPAEPTAADNIFALAPRTRPAEETAPPAPTVAVRTRSWVGWAVAAQLALVVGAGLLFHAPSQGDAAYRALGSAPAAATGDLLVIFNPETPERRLREALKSVDARIVGGPTATGAYLLQVAPSRRAAALGQLRGRADIIMAQPVDAAGSP